MTPIRIRKPSARGTGRAEPRRPGGPAAALKGLAFAIVALGLWFTVNSGRLREYFEARGQRNQNKRVVLELERKISQMEAEKSELQTFGFPAEKAIRERYRMRRPDEGVIYIEEPENAAAPGSAAPNKKKLHEKNLDEPGATESTEDDSPEPSLP